MPIAAKDCCVLNSGAGAWAFEEFATRLATALGVDVSTQPRRLNYVLYVDDLNSLRDEQSFIPLNPIRVATDKRLLASAFNKSNVPAPETHLFSDFSEVRDFLEKHTEREWCLKYPTSCGAHGHRLITAKDPEPANWPQPFVLQEFIRLKEPEVYRVYCAASEMFGWVARRFPSGSKVSPWVAHARGARYVNLNNAPADALNVASKALKATGLWGSFGCVDLLRGRSGWLALEVGTDGLTSHVDRDIGDPDFEAEIERRICKAFWQRAESLA